jgi:hypothetical protein
LKTRRERIFIAHFINEKTLFIIGGRSVMRARKNPNQKPDLECPPCA